MMQMYLIQKSQPSKGVQMLYRVEGQENFKNQHYISRTEKDL